MISARSALAVLAAALLALSAPSNAMAKTEWHASPVDWPAGEAVIDSVPSRCDDCEVHVRLMPASRMGTEWTLQCPHFRATVRVPEQASELYDCRYTVEVLDPQGQCLAKEAFEFDGGGVSLRFIYDGYSARLYSGAKRQQLVCAAIPFSCDKPFAFTLSAPNALKCKLLHTRFSSLPAPELYGGDASDIEVVVAASHDPMVAIWQYLDRDTPAERASLGGRYRLATVPNAEGGYDIVYLDGAEINADAWPPLRIKGTLKPTIFAGNYDLRWTDANGRLLGEDNYAQLSADASILTLAFPLWRSQLRLSRE